MRPEDKKAINDVYVRFGKAIAAYERRLVSTAFEPSPFDRFMAGDEQAMSPAAIRGARLFVGRAGCNECHRGARRSATSRSTTSARRQNRDLVPAVDLGRYAGIDMLVEPVQPRQRIQRQAPGAAHHRAHAAGIRPPLYHPTDGQFKTPTLRNVARTAPYMHDGACATLWDVVDHYNFGGGTGQYAGTKDPAIAPLLLTDAELGDLVEFLRALDDGPRAADRRFPRRA